MTTVGSVKTDAQGRFRIEQDLQADAPHLLQAMHQGVNYNKMLPPKSATTGVQLEVFDSAARAPNAKVTQHMVLLEPSGSELVINETVIYTNTGKVTFNDPDGTLAVYIPEQVTTPIRVTVQGPQGMPVPRPAEKGKASNTYVVRYPIKPGETRVDLTYSMPASSPVKYSGRILHGGGPVRLIAPKGVTLEGSSLNSLGNEPRTQATIYELTGNEYAITVQGTGSLRAAMAAQGSGDEESGPGIDQVKPRIYKRLPWLLALLLIMLTIGFVLLYRNDGVKPRAGKRA